MLSLMGLRRNGARVFGLGVRPMPKLAAVPTTAIASSIPPKRPGWSLTCWKR